MHYHWFWLDSGHTIRNHTFPLARCTNIMRQIYDNLPATGPTAVFVLTLFAILASNRLYKLLFPTSPYLFV